MTSIRLVEREGIGEAIKVIAANKLMQIFIYIHVNSGNPLFGLRDSLVKLFAQIESLFMNKFAANLLTSDSIRFE